METLKIRKNFLLDREVIEKAEVVLKQKHKNFTEAINLYFLGDNLVILLY
jgi:hypothetical protein